VDTPEPTLAAATQCEDWQGVSVHELCHAIQWADGAPVWSANKLTASEAKLRED
jgi:hypothetical protein